MEPPNPPSIHRSNRDTRGSGAAATLAAVVDAAISGVSGSISQSMDGTSNGGPNSTFDTFGTGTDDPGTTFEEHDDDDGMSTDHSYSGDEDEDEDGGSHTDCGSQTDGGSQTDVGSHDGSDFSHSDDDDERYDTLDEGDHTDVGSQTDIGSHTDLGSQEEDDGSLFSDDDDDDDEGADTFDECEQGRTRTFTDDNDNDAFTDEGGATFSDEEDDGMDAGNETFEDDDEETDASASAPRGPKPHMRSGRMTTTAAAVIAAAAGMAGVGGGGGGGRSSLSQAAKHSNGNAAAGAKKKMRSRSANHNGGGAGAGVGVGSSSLGLASSDSSEGGALTSKAQERRERRRQQTQLSSLTASASTSTKAARERVKGGAAAKLLGTHTMPSGRVISHSPPNVGSEGGASQNSSTGAAELASVQQAAATALGSAHCNDANLGSARSRSTTRTPPAPAVPFGSGGSMGASEDMLDFVKQQKSVGFSEDTQQQQDNDRGLTEGNLARSEFRKINEASKKEWDVGTTRNSRYTSTTAKAGGVEESKKENDAFSDASVPSAMAASEVFHYNAKEAIRALLTSPPNAGYRMEDRYNSPAGAAVLEEEDFEDVAAANSNLSNASGGLPGVTSSGSSQMWSDRSGYTKPAPQPLLKPEAEAWLETLHRRMIQPSAQLADLIKTVRRPVATDDATGVTKEVPTLSRGYMTRRKNACGAVKVLLGKKQNRVPLCWSVGLLAALTSVLNDAGPEGAEKEYAADKMTYRAYVEARKRAVAALVAMSAEGENRVLMFHSPGLVQALGKVVREERAECRRGCCAVLAHLSRAPENRLIMPKVPGIAEAMEGVLRPKILGDGRRNGRASPPPVNNKDFRGMKDVASPDRVKRLMKKWGAVNDSHTTDGETDDDNSVSSRISIVQTDTDMGGSFDQDDDEEEEAVEMIMDDEDEDGNGVEAGLAYDNDPNQCLHGARSFVFAALLSLLKEKANALYLARCTDLIATVIAIASFHSSPSHVRATTVLSHMTRHANNTKLLVSRTPGLLPVLVKAMRSPSGNCRTQACRAAQNLAGERTCRQEVANSFDLLESLCACARGDAALAYARDVEEKKDNDTEGPASEEERRAAVGALKNLTDEPANMIPMTNAGDCVATLMQIANGGANSNAAGVTEEMQYMACDALATLSHWLRKIATSGVAPAGGCGATAGKPKELFQPSNQVITWEQWE